MIETQTMKIVAVTPPGAIVDNTSWTSAAIDTLGYDYLDVVVHFGAMDIAMAALKLQTSDTDSNYADLAGADFSVSPATLPADDADNTFVCIHVDLRGKKRFFDLVATGGNGTLGTYLTAFAILSRAGQMPATAAARGFGQELFA